MPDFSTASDETLMDRFRRRNDSGAFEELANRYLAAGAAVARQVLSNRTLAEDAVQEAMLRVVRHRARYLPGRPFSVWFYTILRNVCLDMLRRHGCEARVAAELASDPTIGPGSHSDPVPPEAALTPTLAELLAPLPEPMRDAVGLRVAHGLPFRDVAAALGISEEAAKKRVQRGLRQLRKQADRDALAAEGAAGARATG